MFSSKANPFIIRLILYNIIHLCHFYLFFFLINSETPTGEKGVNNFSQENSLLLFKNFPSAFQIRICLLNLFYKFLSEMQQESWTYITGVYELKLTPSPGRLFFSLWSGNQMFELEVQNSSPFIFQPYFDSVSELFIHCQDLSSYTVNYQYGILEMPTKIVVGKKEKNRTLEIILNKQQISENEVKKRRKKKNEREKRVEKNLKSAKICMETVNSEFFVVQGSKVVRVNPDLATRQIHLNLPLQRFWKYTIKSRVIHSHSRHIWVGIVDISRQKNQLFSSNSGNAVSYTGQGYINYGMDGQYRNMLQGEGFREGEVVEMEVDLGQASITWSVNGQVTASFVGGVLWEQGREWMPFWEMFHGQEAIEYSVC